MVNPRLGIILGAIGVIVVLLPILALFITGGYNSPIQRFYDSSLAPGLPMGILVTAAGAAVTAVGLLIFIKGMREGPAYPTAPAPIRRPLSRPRHENRELEQIEQEISNLLDNQPTMEIRTVQQPPPKRAPAKQEAVAVQTTEKKGGMVVVTRGVDMVCQSCGAVNPLGSKICASCGAQLFQPDAKATPCPVCGAPLDETYKIGENIVCKICFSEIKPNAG
ncbi:MAG: zinc ribbon domain-containing protein [Candidatus Caldarchaeum sp.]|uniref:Zinc ribbon domain-containing protein n=1 Tax=Caldiarchaeum subterraneum TaxID=311458 RepID=A0A7J3G5P8_CALS0